MDRMKESDIVIEGNSLTAASLAYFLSLNVKETITLINTERDEHSISHLTPGIIMPILRLQKQSMEKIYERTIIELKDIHSISGNFELSNNPITLLYRGKEAISLMQEHREKFDKSTLNYRHLSLEDITNYYPFFNIEEELYITEIYNSYSCSNIDDLVFSFQKLARENDVEIIREQKDIYFDQEKECFKTEDREYTGNKLNIVTSPKLNPELSLEKKRIMKVFTPVLEKFPKISMFDITNDTMMWLEEAGYLHILRMFNQLSEKQCIERIQNNFENTFPHLGSLQIADLLSSDLKTNLNLEKSLGKIKGIHSIYFCLPLIYELSMIPSLAIAFSRLVENNKYLLDKITIEELASNL